LKKNILLIDDDLNHLAALAVALADAGYQVIPKIDAGSAIAALREDIRIDLIVSDYEMPGLDTLSFMTMLKQLMPKVPVIVLSGQGNINTYLEVMSLGAFEYMNKPVRVNELRRIVDAALLDSGRMDHCRHADLKIGNREMIRSFLMCSQYIKKYEIQEYRNATAGLIL
jgi:DNA-binding NtrC family response regulator